MAAIYKRIKIVFIPVTGICMPLIFYSGDDLTKLFTWFIFSILATFLSWEIGSLISKKISKKFPLLFSPGKHITALVLFFTLLSIIIIFSIYFVNILFHTAGNNYWSEMKGMHLCIILGTFMLISIHEGIDIYLNWKKSTQSDRGNEMSSGSGVHSSAISNSDYLSDPSIKNLTIENTHKGNNIFKKNFTVQIGSKIKIIPVTEIAYFYALDKGVYIKTFANRDYPVDETLTELNPMLNSEFFHRINRKYIVNIKSINELITLSKSKLKVLLNPSSPIEIILGYPKSAELKAWLNR